MAAIDTTSYGQIDGPDNGKKDVGSTLALLDYDKGTAWTNYLAISAGAFFSLACIITAGVTIAQNPNGAIADIRYKRLALRSSMEYEAFSLLVNVALTLVTDALSFIHSISLRWALASEGRLEFNTNIRLLTSSRRGGPNSWWANAFSLATLMLCYGSTSVLFMTNVKRSQVQTSTQEQLGDDMCPGPACANMVALAALGIGLAAQTAIAAWCLFAARDKTAHGTKAIPTWSTSPLNAALTALHTGLVTHRGGRCMVSVHQRDALTDGGVIPSKQQSAVWGVHRAVRYVVYYLWGLSFVAAAWPVIIAVVVREFWDTPRFSWTPDNFSAIVLAMSPAENIDQMDKTVTKGTYFSFGSELVLGVIFVTAIQALQTTGLHAAELLTNLSRDEGAWRQATKSGATYKSEPFLAALMSWENIVLFLAKSLLHWIMGQGMSPQVGTIITFSGATKGAMFLVMSWPRIIVFAACAIFMALFTTFLAFRRPKGPQPAAWGHLQTLADLIDDWNMSKERHRPFWFKDKRKFWWGDKRASSSTRSETGVVGHAGMNSAKENIGEIIMDAFYAGDESNTI